MLGSNTYPLNSVSEDEIPLNLLISNNASVSPGRIRIDYRFSLRHPTQLTSVPSNGLGLFTFTPVTTESGNSTTVTLTTANGLKTGSNYAFTLSQPLYTAAGDLIANTLQSIIATCTGANTLKIANTLTQAMSSYGYIIGLQDSSFF
jgi:hypothetical protein